MKDWNVIACQNYLKNLGYGYETNLLRYGGYNQVPEIDYHILILIDTKQIAGHCDFYKDDIPC